MDGSTKYWCVVKWAFDLLSVYVLQVPPSAPQASVCKSLSQIQNIEEVEELSVKELKRILTANFVDFKGCCEKTELLDRVRALWKSKQEMNKRKSKAWFLSLIGCFYPFFLLPLPSAAARRGHVT